jgi:MYXO-CTERM domain-containing protein
VAPAAASASSAASQSSAGGGRAASGPSATGGAGPRPATAGAHEARPLATRRTSSTHGVAGAGAGWPSVLGALGLAAAWGTRRRLGARPRLG